jgi:site-specific recombinase XerD
VNRFKALLSLTFRLGVDNGKMQSNPAKLVRRRREDNGRIRWLSQAEEIKLRAAIMANYSEHISELDIALNTGLRRGEQYSITWDCVSFDRRLLTISQTKNGQTRHIPMNSAAAAALRILQKRSLGSGPVFMGARGDRLSSPRHWFEKAVRDAGLSDFTWHCLRHTFASRLVMAGVDLRTVQELMGHKTIAMTCRYAHLAPSHKLAAVERLSATAPRQKTVTDTGTDTDAMEIVQTGQETAH